MPAHSDGLADGELPARTEAAVETRLQRLKRIALFSADLLAAPSASDEASGTMGTVRTTTDVRRSARLTSTMEMGDDDGTVVDGGTTQGMVGGPPTWAAATDATVEVTGIPGRLMLCINHARCGRASRTQKNYPAYCYDECAHTAGHEHAEHCGVTQRKTESHVPGSAEMELVLNDTTTGEMYF